MMSHAKQASKRRSRAKAVTVLGVCGSVVAGGRRVQGSRWSGRRYTDGEHGAGNYSR